MIPNCAPSNPLLSMLLDVISGFVSLLYVRVCISSVTINSKLSCCVQVFWCYFSNAQMTGSDQMKSQLYWKQQQSFFCIQFYLSIFSFYCSKLNTNTNEQRVYIYSLCAWRPSAFETATSQPHYLNQPSNWSTRMGLAWNQLEKASMYL